MAFMSFTVSFSTETSTLSPTFTLLRSTDLSALSFMSVLVPSGQKVIVPAFASTPLTVPIFDSAAKTTDTSDTTITTTARTTATYFIVYSSLLGLYNFMSPYNTTTLKNTQLKF